MSERQTRRKWSPSEKLRIVLAGLDRGSNLSELCRQEGINVNQYYQWKKQLQSSAKDIFEKQTTSKEEQLAADNQRLRNVIAEITSENLELKKGRWV
jgi:transposase-like protein